MNTPQKVTLTKICTLPADLMLAYTTEAEAIKAAEKNGQPFYYQFLATYFVAKKTA